MKINEDIADIITFGEKNNEYKVIEEFEWICHGKGETKTIIFEHDSKFYELIRLKSGDDYWDADDQNEWECSEVEKISITTHKWQIKKEKNDG